VTAYSLTIKSSAAKELQGASDNATLPRLIGKIKSLATQPRPLESEKLAGRSNLYRVRQGNYRVIHSVDDQTRIVDVVKVGHREDIYRQVDFLASRDRRERRKSATAMVASSLLILSPIRIQQAVHRKPRLDRSANHAAHKCWRAYNI
jgi:mRNA interferase RelE/StbE